MTIINKISANIDLFVTSLTNTPRRQYSTVATLAVATLASGAWLKYKVVPALVKSANVLKGTALSESTVTNAKANKKWNTRAMNLCVTAIFLSGIGIGALLGRKS